MDVLHLRKLVMVMMIIILIMLMIVIIMWPGRPPSEQVGDDDGNDGECCQW